MCGIVGYVGNSQVGPILIDGLSKLEYRGYDSAGICVHTASGMRVEKTKGKLAVLQRKCDGGRALPGTVGIGHTRWATHGAPSDINSHPHLSNSKRIAVVHNGILENEAELRHWLEQKGVRFLSETDTEVIANLIDWHYEETGEFFFAVRKAVACLKGSYALAILCADLPEVIIAVRKDSPLVLGYGEEGYHIASDISAIIKYTRQVSYLDDGDLAVVRKDSVSFYNGGGERIEIKKETVEWDVTAAERGGFAHYMLKEIMQQPKAVADTRMRYVQNGRIALKGVGENWRKVYFVGCGSAYYVSLLAKYSMEQLCRISSEAVVASEFRYADPVLDSQDLVVVISQSGETADSLSALRVAKQKGAKTLAIVNVVGSAIAKEADNVLYTYAGPEVSVATTKAFSSQLMMVNLLCLYVAEKRGTLNQETYVKLISYAENLPAGIETVLSPEVQKDCETLARYYADQQQLFFIGRNLDSAVCMEGSLKIKEIAYVNSDAYPAGEIKHGPMSLIQEDSLVIALATTDHVFEKMTANIREVKSRGAKVICITVEDKMQEMKAVADHVITVPGGFSVFQPGLSVIPLQLFAYYMAVARGCDVDKPRNLAKSVTVE